MSLTIEPDFQTFIVRIADILKNSALLLPNSIGGDEDAKDLVSQIILNQLPIPQLPVDGPGPPHIYVTESETPIIDQIQQGRNSIDVQGGKRETLEFYIIVLSGSTSRQEAELQLFDIISAVTTTLNQNKRLLDPVLPAGPLAVTHTYTIKPFLYDITQNETVAKNVVIRPVVGVNLR